MLLRVFIALAALIALQSCAEDQTVAQSDDNLIQVANPDGSIEFIPASQYKPARFRSENMPIPPDEPGYEIDRSPQPKYSNSTCVGGDHLCLNPQTNREPDSLKKKHIKKGVRYDKQS